MNFFSTMSVTFTHFAHNKKKPH